MYSINVINLPWMIHFTMRPSYLPSVRHIYYQCLFIHVFYHQCVIFNTINTYHQCVILTPWAQFYVHSGDEEWDSVQTPRLDLIVTLHGVVVVVQVDYPSLPRLTGIKLLPTQGVLWKTSDTLHQYQEWTDVKTLYNVNLVHSGDSIAAYYRLGHHLKYHTNVLPTEFYFFC